MGIVTIDRSELEYLKSCRDKLRDIVVLLGDKKDKIKSRGKENNKDEDKELSTEEKLREIKKILKQLL
ncbi:MAG: hypothetical protein AAB972_04410 [Patescibacteria group bacterium]